MKKYLLIAALLLGVVAADARDYKHSLGINAGSLNGITYKGYVGESEHFVFQMDANVQIGYAPKSKLFIYSKSNVASGNYTTDPFAFYAAVVNPNLMYQGNVGDWNWASMHWFIGGGIDLGLAWETARVSGGGLTVKHTEYGAKVSEHLLTGIEFDFKSVPLNLGLDLRPGAGELLYFPSTEGVEYTATLFFDWAANLSLRYRF